MNPLKRLVVPVLVLLVIVIFGLIGYMQIEKWSFMDSLYMLVITLFTVGFHEVNDLSNAGRILTMLIIVGGVGSALYVVGVFGEIIVEGQLIGYRRRKRMERDTRNMKDHYIICGYGRVGHQVAQELEAARKPFVVIDMKQETAAELELKGIPYLVANATSNGVLSQAGIDRAKVLFSCADSDTENVFVTLSARAANPKLLIIARASGPDAQEKLKLAGANRVLSPYFIAGQRMAELVLKDENK